MEIYSIENTKRDIKQENLYDLFYPMLEDRYSNIEMLEYTVPMDREMRIDLVCMDIFGTNKYIDELMIINNIIDPYSIKIYDKILYPADRNKIENIRKGYIEDEELSRKAKLRSINDEELTVLKPEFFKQITVDDTKKEIKLTNKLK